MKLVKDYIKLREEKNILDIELKELNEKIKELEVKLSDFFVEQGMTSIKLDGKNVILVEKKSVKQDNSKALVNWLTENGYTECFNKPVNTVSFSSVFNKQLTDSQRAEIAQHIEITDYYQFQMRKA